METEIYLKKIDLELDKRKSFNSKYSLRAFARDLEISVSILSRLRSRSIPFSSKLKKRIKTKLFKNDDEFNLFSANCLCDPSFFGLKKKFETRDFYYFRYWYFWTIWELSKINNIQLAPAQLAQQFSIPESDVKAILEWVTKINQAIKSNEYENLSFDNIFKNLNQSIFEERYIQLIHQLPTSLLSDVRPYISQKAYPMAINQELANVIQDKITKLTEEISSLIASDQNSKDRVCELTISLLPASFPNE